MQVAVERGREDEARPPRMEGDIGEWAPLAGPYPGRQIGALAQLLDVRATRLSRVEDVAEAVLRSYAQVLEARAEVESRRDPAPVRPGPVETLNADRLVASPGSNLSQVPELDPVRQGPRDEDVVRRGGPGFESLQVGVSSGDLENLVNFVLVNPWKDLGDGLLVEVDDPQGPVGASRQDEVGVKLVDRAERVDGLAVVQLDRGRPPEPEVFGGVGRCFFGRPGRARSDLVHVQRVGTGREQELVLKSRPANHVSEANCYLV